jgi:hypothetical protein
MSTHPAGGPGSQIEAPRCLKPLTRYDKPGRQDAFPVCWRPKDHRGAKHLSKWAYERELGRAAELARRRRQRAGP